MPEVAIVAALEREIGPLIRHWRASEREYSGGHFRFVESENRVAVCGGIGPRAARRATEAIISLYRPSLVLSVGFAGALDSTLHVGQVFEPRQVIDASDGSRSDTGSGSGILVSFSSVAGPEQKTRLATAYQAQAVDMEAGSVAKGAEAHGLRFRAIKVISDEAGFRMPPMERFIGDDGSFQSANFALYAAQRPWLWGPVFRLARNSAKASHQLCAYLNKEALASASVPVRAGS
ncbi:MAG: phosphorylase [Terriglobales bacterium]